MAGHGRQLTIDAAEVVEDEHRRRVGIVLLLGVGALLADRLRELVPERASVRIVRFDEQHDLVVTRQPPRELGSTRIHMRASSSSKRASTSSSSAPMTRTTDSCPPSLATPVPNASRAAASLGSVAPYE